MSLAELQPMGLPTPGPSLEGKEVLITRAVGEAVSTAARVRDMGFVPVVAPLLVIETRVMEAGAVDAVLFTSGNAVAAVRADGTPVFAVGDATAGRARAAGFSDVSSAGGDAGDLLALVRSRCRVGATLLLAVGRGQGFGLARDLRAAGFRVRRRVAYVARPVMRLPETASVALAAGGVRAALFLSAETARTFGRVLPESLLPALGGVEALAVGAAAGDALAPLPWRRVRVSLGPTLEQVLALL